ncbi:uncharacterized protein G2W53_017934 [Senna tora]|uniref:Uncharacterized protein n=1 Tax=Senna tora TaxID=362788 RepID=A0A834TR35_9FABA|nr:uncharacterized protein G2W53_017934 [Senna tora]
MDKNQREKTGMRTEKNGKNEKEEQIDKEECKA